MAGRSGSLWSNKGRAPRYDLTELSHGSAVENALRRGSGGDEQGPTGRASSRRNPLWLLVLKAPPGVSERLGKVVVHGDRGFGGGGRRGEEGGILASQ